MDFLILFRLKSLLKFTSLFKSVSLFLLRGILRNLSFKKKVVVFYFESERSFLFFFNFMEIFKKIIIIVGLIIFPYWKRCLFFLIRYVLKLFFVLVESFNVSYLLFYSYNVY